MNRVALLFAILAVALPCAATAQVIPASTPDPQVYDDPGMHFRAPDGFVLVGRRPIGVESLSGDPHVVAAWRNSRMPPRVITIQQESYEGDVDGFESLFEQQLRNQYQDALIQHQEPMSLRNGMPAMFMELTAGSGFDERKGYIIIWADGTRGVAITLLAQIGDLDIGTAKRLLSDASAVRYPAGRE
jgi:hypothetical protein